MVIVGRGGGVAGALVAAGGLFAAVFAGASGHGWESGGEVVEVKFGGAGSSGCGWLHACQEFSVVVFLGGGESSVFISGGWLG